MGKKKIKKNSCKIEKKKKAQACLNALNNKQKKTIFFNPEPKNRESSGRHKKCKRRVLLHAILTKGEQHASHGECWGVSVVCVCLPQILQQLKAFNDVPHSQLSYTFTKTERI